MLLGLLWTPSTKQQERHSLVAVGKAHAVSDIAGANDSGMAYAMQQLA